MKKIILLLVSLLMCFSCQSESLTTALLKVKDHSIKVELAETPESRQKGLMFRKSLNEDSGMLFIFEEERQLSFWMKNTSIPLSIAYIGKDGIIKQISPLEPYSQQSVRSQRSVKYALEVNRNYFSDKGIRVGDQVQFPDEWPY